jgi:hypothetical protein
VLWAKLTAELGNAVKALEPLVKNKTEHKRWVQELLKK